MDPAATSLLPPSQVGLGLTPIHYTQELPSQAPPPPQPTTVKVKGGPGRPLTLDRKRPYPCELCPSKFGSKMELEEHQNSHTGEKPFECDVCKARFNRRSTLWNHKRIHSDTKPFCCPVCGMTFKWKNSLKCHKEMHLRKNEAVSVDLETAAAAVTYAGSHRKASAAQPPQPIAQPQGHVQVPPHLLSHRKLLEGPPPAKAPKKSKKKAPQAPPSLVTTHAPLTLTTLPIPTHPVPPQPRQFKTEPGLDVPLSQVVSSAAPLCYASVKSEGVGQCGSALSYSLAPQPQHHLPASRAQDLVGQSHSSILQAAMQEPIGAVGGVAGQSGQLSSLLAGGVGGGSLASSAHSNSSSSSSGGYSPPSDPAPPSSTYDTSPVNGGGGTYFYAPAPPPVGHYDASPHSGLVPAPQHDGSLPHHSATGMGPSPGSQASFYQAPSSTLLSAAGARSEFAFAAPPPHQQQHLHPAPISLPTADYPYAPFDDLGPGYTLVPSSFASAPPPQPPPHTLPQAVSAHSAVGGSPVGSQGHTYVVKVLPYNEW